MIFRQRLKKEQRDCFKADELEASFEKYVEKTQATLNQLLKEIEKNEAALARATTPSGAVILQK